MSDDTTNATSFAAQHASASDAASLSFAKTDGGTFNTIRFPLVPVACWRLNSPGFAFDSSMVLPTFREEIATLHKVVDANPGCPAALFGHCDPAGADDLNKTLGDRRAIAIYALLTRQPDLWEYLYSNPQVGDAWGTRAVQTALWNLADPQGNAYYGPDHTIDGDYGSGTTDAVKRFQQDAGQRGSGQADAATRKALFAAYMDWLCTPEVGSATAFKMKVEDFLGGAGAKAGDLPKMSLQGCSELNPVVLLSASEMSGGGDTSQRNADNAPNRRVMMFFFKSGTVANPATWPCPKVKESMAGCKKALWPDGDARRKNGPALREYRITRDTMACRFYDRFARRSPCEGSAIPARKVSWIARVPDWAGGTIELFILNAQGETLASWPASAATPLSNGWLSFDLSSLDPATDVVIELRSDGVCVLPPVSLGINAMLGQSAAGTVPPSPAYAFNSLVRPPNSTV
jgi:hypothetical protein